MSVFGALAALVSWLAAPLQPVFAASATAAAIVLFTALLRSVLHPLNRRAFRGDRAKVALAPRLAELRRRYADRTRAERRRAARKLYAQAGTSPRAGCLPMLVQLPLLYVVHEVFSAERLNGKVNRLLTEGLLGAPLGGHWADALSEDGFLGGDGLVFLGLFAAIAVVARWSVLRARRAAAAGFGPLLPAEDEPGAAVLRRIAPLIPLMAFGTLLMAAYVPLAAGLYLLASMTWTTAERSWLQRWWTRTAGGPGAGAVGGSRGRGRSRIRGRSNGGGRHRHRAETPPPGRHRRQEIGKGRHRRPGDGTG